MKDLEDKDDIILLVNTFYSKIRNHKNLGYIFNEVARINWEEHLPRMYSFWGSLLLGEHSYSGNPMTKHLSLSKITSLTEIEFNEWLMLFSDTVDELFRGKVANDAKLRAENIARLMLYKIQSNI